jgi:hypothetical protein
MSYAAGSPFDSDDISPFWHFATQLNGQSMHHHQIHHQSSMVSDSPPTTCNTSVTANTESNLSSSTDTLDSDQKKPVAPPPQETYPGVVPHKDLMLMPLKLAGSLPDDTDFLKGGFPPCYFYGFDQ